MLYNLVGNDIPADMMTSSIQSVIGCPQYDHAGARGDTTNIPFFVIIFLNFTTYYFTNFSSNY